MFQSSDQIHHDTYGTAIEASTPLFVGLVLATIRRWIAREAQAVEGKGYNEKRSRTAVEEIAFTAMWS